MDLISEFYGGYRYFGYWSSPQRYGQQYRVYNRNDVVKLLNTWNGVYNCGISVCTFKGEIPFLLYLPFDFDSDSLEKSWEDAYNLYNWIVDEGWDITINYSGYRGFHCLISVVPDFYSRQQIKSAQEFYKNILNLKTCDPQIFGDIRRLIRIPGTAHVGKFKRVKGKGWVRMGEGGYCKTIKHSPGELLNLDDYWEDKYPEYQMDRETNGISYHEYPCVVKAMNHREPGQLIRYSHTAYLLKRGMTPEEILEDYELRHGDGRKYEWDDWNKDYTYRQIIHIADNPNYNPLKCSTLKAMGYCLGSECPYFQDDFKVKSVKEMKL